MMRLVCCSVLRCVAVCCSVLQCAALCCSVLQGVAGCCSATVRGQGAGSSDDESGVLQIVAVCAEVCCRVLQRIAIERAEKEMDSDG